MIDRPTVVNGQIIMAPCFILAGLLAGCRECFDCGELSEDCSTLSRVVVGVFVVGVAGLVVLAWDVWFGPWCWLV